MLDEDEFSLDTTFTDDTQSLATQEAFEDRSESINKITSEMTQLAELF